MAASSFNLRELADYLGLSQTTVSRALNGFPEVSEKTRARVVEAAERFNYRPSLAASGLATGKSRIIGHVVPISGHMMINPHFSDFIAGASESYSRAGYDMLIRMVPHEDQERVYRDIAGRSRADGVVVHGPLVDDPRIPLLRALGLPFVVHGRSDHSDNGFSWLDVNNLRAFYRATGLLLDLGHERIALVNGLENMNFAWRRRLGYEQALAARGIAADPALMFSDDMVEPYGYDATMKLIRSADPPTAILYSSILPALGGMRALTEAGLKPGVDLSLITYDDCLSFLQSAGSSSQGIPLFTVVRSSIREAGRRVAEMLIDQIERRHPAPIQELWEAELVIGRSTGPAPR